MRRQMSAIRVAADYAERFPELPIIHYSGTTSWNGEAKLKVHFWQWSTDEESRIKIENEMIAVMDALTDITGQPLEWVKNDPTENSYTEKYYEVTAQLSPVATISLSAERAVLCERVVVLTGTEKVEERDPELVEKALEGIPTVIVEKPKEIVEWQCNPVIAAKTNPVAVPA